MSRNEFPGGEAMSLTEYRFGLRISERGNVVAVGDGIAWVTGLPSAAMEEIIQFSDGSEALVFHLTEGVLGAILLHATESLTAGTAAYLTGQRLSIPVGDALLGRVVDPLGQPLDGGEPAQTTGRRPLESKSPSLTERTFIRQPLYTGCKIVDTMIPIGRGQRQLLVGDEGVGRSSLALDAVVNQTADDVLCVYVLIAQKRSAVLNTLETLREHSALERCVVVVAEAASLPGMTYLAPFAGCAIAEYWMRRGRHTLVVYDDLSTHARAYRELSLLLRRPPGREAYPGDIFYLHARLLERATCLAPEQGGGSMTALPIVETQQGEIAAYVPTNLISITDGQVYLDRGLFVSGFRPAIDVAKSVSRIGGEAQHPRIKEAAGSMKLDYLQFLELEVFTRFGARLEASMENKIRRGRVLREVLKQDRLTPMRPEFQLAWLTAYGDGLLDDLAPEAVEPVLGELDRAVAESGLTLDSPPDTWKSAVRGWLNRTPEAPQ